MPIPFPGTSIILSAIRRLFAIGGLALMLLSGKTTAMAQTPTPAMVETHMKAWFAAWASLNPEAIVKVDPPANGFGFRSPAVRSAGTPMPEYSKKIKSFLGLMDYFRIELNELHTAVEGDVGLAWGFHTEDYKLKGQAPRKVRVRFTVTLKYERNGWRTLLYHRDIQQFDERGYPVISR
ncbi:MAG: nuclear transport factor 2 family protein [Acidobacteria bacterium]|nr:nuclear transport factor 2 family protein [Acidobacteriota bacterium]